MPRTLAPCPTTQPADRVLDAAVVQLTQLIARQVVGRGAPGAPRDEDHAHAAEDPPTGR